ncbi:hypothetical protein LINPERPRIM_LOCUS37127 [Linum perenne]
MGDDLWLLCCSSEEDVERIFSLNRWEPPGHRIRADKWLSGSGTSNVESQRGWVWAIVKGIPLHLRSEALRRDIKSWFGEGAVWSEIGCNLNEIRVRFHLSFEAPKGIKIQFKGNSFWLSVVRMGEGNGKEGLSLENNISSEGEGRSPRLVSGGGEIGGPTVGLELEKVGKAIRTGDPTVVMEEDMSRVDAVFDGEKGVEEMVIGTSHGDVRVAVDET